MPTEITSTGITFPDATTQTTAAAAGGAAQRIQVFTAPGTWTCPANTTRAIVSVVGGGGGGNSPSFPGGGNPGNSSSFGSLVSATGGTRALNGNSGSAVGNPGTGTVSVGTAIKTGAAGIVGERGLIGGTTRPSGNDVAYSTTGAFRAGLGNSFGGGQGGGALADVPVSTPQTVTIGNGGNGTGPQPAASIRGAVLVEFTE
jgi:hypothetical protein